MPKYRLKGLTANQEKEFGALKSKFPNHQFLDEIMLARILDPRTFPYSKPDRLYNEVSQKVIQSWKDIGDIFFHLPDHYRKEIISSEAFDRLFSTNILTTLQFETEKKRKHRKQKEASATEDVLFRLYLKFFRIGYFGLANMMPYEFRNYFTAQISPLYGLMRSISEYMERINPKKTNLRKYGFEPVELGA